MKSWWFAIILPLILIIITFPIWRLYSRIACWEVLKQPHLAILMYKILNVSTISALNKDGGAGREYVCSGWRLRSVWRRRFIQELYCLLTWLTYIVSRGHILDAPVRVPRASWQVIGHVVYVSHVNAPPPPPSALHGHRPWAYRERCFTTCDTQNRLTKAIS